MHLGELTYMRGNGRARLAIAAAPKRTAGTRRAAACIATLGSVALIAGLACGSAAAAVQQTAGRRAAAAASDWPAYLNGPRHTSYSPSQTTITTANASTLTLQWHVGNGAYLASPTVADGAVFIGSSNGYLYKLDETTGAVLDRYYIGRQPAKTCPAVGVVSTATVATDPSTHQLTVYVAGPDGYLYALSAANLTLDWKSVVGIPSKKISNYFNWSSPTVAHNRVYIGISSNCDTPLIHGGVASYSQASGRKLSEFHTVPADDIGGSVWSSIGIGPNGDVYATTGNGPNGAPELAYSDSIIKLGPYNLRYLGSFKIPASQALHDGDFGASPVFFDGDVGACNKNGIFYALHTATMRLAWEQRIGAKANGVEEAECSAAPAYNGKDLFFGGPGVTIDGTGYRGSVQERNPANGKLIWETGLPNGVVGTPSLDGAGVLAVGTYEFKETTRNATYLVNASNGTILSTVTQGLDFPQSTFADDWLFTANYDGVSAWALP